MHPLILPSQVFVILFVIWASILAVGLDIFSATLNLIHLEIKSREEPDKL